MLCYKVQMDNAWQKCSGPVPFISLAEKKVDWFPALRCGSRLVARTLGVLGPWPLASCCPQKLHSRHLLHLVVFFWVKGGETAFIKSIVKNAHLKLNLQFFGAMTLTVPCCWRRCWGWRTVQADSKEEALKSSRHFDGGKCVVNF